MAKFNLYLRDKNSNEETPIQLFISWNNNRIKHPTNEVAIPKEWDFKKQNVLDKRGNLELREKSKKLSNYILQVREIFIKCENHYNRSPTKQELKDYLEKKINIKSTTDDKNCLLSYILKFMKESETRTNDLTGKPIAKGTIQTYNQVYNMIKKYSTLKKRKITFDDITLDFYHEFHTFLVHQDLATNTIGKRIAILKTIIREATERGYNKNLSFQSKKFKVTREKTDNIYLNENELNEMYKLDLSNVERLDKVRDLFLIGSYTGLRFSDFSKFTNKNIVNSFIEINTQKNKEPVAIPLHDIVKQIMEKYEGGLPRALTNQKMNKYLKEIGEKMNCLNTSYSKNITKGGKEITTNYIKHELLCTHTARRSFASNLFIEGIPAQTIMKITGHKTEKSFMLYIKITPKENANIIKLHWEKMIALKDI